jgi:hypothetical protein
VICVFKNLAPCRLSGGTLARGVGVCVAGREKLRHATESNALRRNNNEGAYGQQRCACCSSGGHTDDGQRRRQRIYTVTTVGLNVLFSFQKR